MDALPDTTEPDWDPRSDAVHCNQFDAYESGGIRSS